MNFLTPLKLFFAGLVLVTLLVTGLWLWQENKDQKIQKIASNQEQALQTLLTAKDVNIDLFFALLEQGPHEAFELIRSTSKEKWQPFQDQIQNQFEKSKNIESQLQLSFLLWKIEAQDLDTTLNFFYQTFSKNKDLAGRMWQLHQEAFHKNSEFENMCLKAVNELADENALKQNCRNEIKNYDLDQLNAAAANNPENLDLQKALIIAKFQKCLKVLKPELTAVLVKMDSRQIQRFLRQNIDIIPPQHRTIIRQSFRKKIPNKISEPKYQHCKLSDVKI